MQSSIECIDVLYESRTYRNDNCETLHFTMVNLQLNQNPLNVILYKEQFAIIIYLNAIWQTYVNI